MKNVRFIDRASGSLLSDGCELAKNWKKDKEVTVYWHDAIVNFFWRCFVSRVKISPSFLVQVSRQYHDWFLSYDNFKELTRIKELKD